MFNYETVIGIEVHAELNTKHKIFSPSVNNINSAPNTNIHPIDLALPGTLPRFNEEVLTKALIICRGLNMQVTKKMHWDRKNYFYQDNPKGYQITQQETPIGRNGKILLNSGKEIRIDFMHMEEDTAKSFHDNDKTLLDFNRCGVPLVEIVTKADISNAIEAKEYLEKLRQILLYLDVSDCKMNEGSFRVDVNISQRPVGQKTLNPKVEIKNLNSFNNVILAIENEVKLQTKAYNSNEKVVQCTKRFDEKTKSNVIMRIKETKDDYRYFPEPDLPFIILSDEYIENSTKDIKALPSEILNQLKNTGLTDKEASDILKNKDMSEFLLNAVKQNLDGKKIFNYLTVNIAQYLNQTNTEFKDLNISISNFIDIENLLTEEKISSSHVKKIIPKICEDNLNVIELVEKLGLLQITDESEIEKFVLEVLQQSPDSIELFLNGKDRAYGFMVGQIMKKAKGQASPKIVNKILTDKLNKIKGEK